MSTIYDLLQYRSLKLLLARDKLVMLDDFERGTDDLYGWEVSVIEGEVEQGWHVMTNETNEDKSSGLEGGTAIDSLGAWKESTAEKEIILKNYGEISFEHYVKNDPLADGVARKKNILRFYIDDQLKLEVKGPSPWYRCEPIGLTPGAHKLRFEYILPEGDKDPNERKAVVDTITVYEAADVMCLITKYTPPKPAKGISGTAILRGFTTYQEMVEADTKIEFTAAFEGIDFHSFMLHASDVHYFVDEFGVCYRGLFTGEMEPESVALHATYVVDLEMTAGQKTGKGFC